MPEQLKDYYSERITLPPATWVRRKFDFQPAEVSLIAYTLPINSVLLRMGGMKGGSPIPLLTQGPISIPGMQGNQVVELYSNDPLDIDIHLIVQQGYAPSVLAAPTSGSKNTTFKVNAELVANSLVAFNYQHVGGMLLVGWIARDAATAVPVLSQLLCSGTPISLLPAYSRSISNFGVAARWSYLLDVPAGTVQLAPTLATCTEAIWHVFSLTPGATPGNIQGDGSSTTPMTVSIVNQYATSKALSLAVCHAGNPVEGSGAIIMDGGNFATYQYLLHRRETLGSNAFIYSVLGDEHAIAQVEIFMP